LLFDSFCLDISFNFGDLFETNETELIFDVSLFLRVFWGNRENTVTGILYNNILYNNMLNKYAKKSKPRNKTRKIKGGIANHYNEVFKTPSWQSGKRPWATLVKIDGLEVYGSSIPYENIYRCLATFQFYMHVKNIKRIISLQGCDVEDGDLTDNCDGHLPPDSTTDKKYESRIWNALKEVSLLHSQDTNIEFVNHKIVDMQAGNLTEWLALYKYDYTDPKQITLIHCLAGFGRTGSILFLIWLKYYYTNNSGITENISKPHLGYNNGSIMITTLTTLFNRDLFLDDDTKNGECQKRINLFKPISIIEELINIKGRDGKVSLHLVNLLIVRMNYILICLGLGFKGEDVSTICLYKKTYTPNIKFEGIFLNPDEIEIDKLDGILQDPKNPYGIRI